MFTNLVSDGNVVCDLLQYFTLLQCFVEEQTLSVSEIYCVNNLAGTLIFA